MTKRDAKDEKKAPKLRFKGFTDDWEQVKLGEIFTECTEKSRDGNEPLLSVTINDGVVKSESLDRKSNASKDKSNYKIVRPNNIAYNSMRMWQGAVGVSNYYGIVSPAYTVISLNETTNSPFFYQYYFKKSSSLNTFRKNSQGLTPDTWNLKYPLFKLIKYRIPQYDEQKKIGQLFQKLDYTINLHEEKQKQLEQLKKALLQKMFADKTNFPEIRFNGYVGPWEQVKFGKITSKYKTRNKDGEQLRSFSVSNIYGFIPQEEQFENGGIALNADKKNSIIVTPNSFAYNPARINVGSIGYYNGNENVLVSSLYEVFKLHKEYDPNYLWFWLKSNHFNWWIHRLQEGSVRSYFYYDKFSEIKERMPSLPEQMKIGQLLKSLDHTITLHDQKIEDLKQLKQALLQQMFI